MMLDAEAVVEAEVVAERKLAPELLVALVRGHVGLAPGHGRSGRISWGGHSNAAQFVFGRRLQAPEVSVTRRQFFNSGLIKSGEGILDAHPQNSSLGGDLGERQQNEGPFERSGCGKVSIGVVRVRSS